MLPSGSIGSLPGLIEVKVYSGRTRLGLHYVKAAVLAEDGIDAARIKAHSVVLSLAG